MGSLRQKRQLATVFGQIVTFKPLSSGWLKCNVCKTRIKQGKTYGHAKSHEPARAPRLQRAKINWRGSWSSWRHSAPGYVSCPLCNGRNNATKAGEMMCYHCRKEFIAEE